MWKKGLVVKVFKKGDLHECNNGRGVTSLPAIKKIFLRTLLGGSRKAQTRNFERSRVSFHPREVHLKKIFILRNVLVQANEWRACLYTHFLDFEKAFDYVHIKSLWNIKRSNETRDKMVKVTVGIYMSFDCAVVDRSVTSYQLTIKYGVKIGA